MKGLKDMDFTPIGNNVLLCFPQEGELQDGVYVGKAYRDRKDARVVAVGPKVRELRVGMTVVANVYDGLPHCEDGVEYRPVPEDRLLAVDTL